MAIALTEQRMAVTLARKGKEINGIGVFKYESRIAGIMHWTANVYMKHNQFITKSS